MIDNLPDDSDLRKRSILALRKMCGVYGIIPASYFVKFVEGAFAAEGSCDVRKCTVTGNTNKVVAVRVLRICESDFVDEVGKVNFFLELRWIGG